MSLKTFLRNASNLIGWSTSRKIIVLESDDWGAIRMSGPQAYQALQKKGLKPGSADEERYLINDGLATAEDLTALIELLDSIKDANQRSAVFTVLGIVANPDFEQIKRDDFQQYSYLTLPETLKRYPKHDGAWEMWKEGITSKVFVPQFHGREHLNVQNWLKALRANESITRDAFDYQIYGISPNKPINHVSYQAAFDIDEPQELSYLREVLKDGLQLFEQLMGYQAKFFVPTNGPFHNDLQDVLAEMKLPYMGTSKIQHMPIGFGKTKKVFHYLGQKSAYGQRYLTRNCFFEPSSAEKSDWVDACLKEIAIAFTWKKPAVISTHRVNYIGWLNPANRTKGLQELKRLLTAITRQWPDVEFMTSDQLGDLIAGKKP
jgi:hypothetical protein